MTRLEYIPEQPWHPDTHVVYGSAQDNPAAHRMRHNGRTLCRNIMPMYPAHYPIEDWLEAGYKVCKQCAKAYGKT